MPINYDDQELILALASSSASLADSPGDQDNWIERAGPGGRGGELPPYVRKLARGIMKSGKSKSQAIAIAISRIKRWAAGGEDVNADTRAKAAKALAEWESLKSKSKKNKLVKLSRDEGGYYAEAQAGFNTDIVNQAWYALCDHLRSEYAKDEPGREYGDEAPSVAMPYIQELWTTFIIVRVPRDGQAPVLLKIPYRVSGLDVLFGEPVVVKATFEEVETEYTHNERVLLSGVLPPDIIGG
jgi:hypothetical protein